MENENYCVSGSYTIPQPIIVEDEEIVFDNWVQAPRWAHFATFLRKLCCDFGITPEITEEKGFIQVTTFYKLCGKRSVISAINKNIQQALEDYKNR